MSICTYIRMSICTYVRMSICTYVDMYIVLHVYEYMWIYAAFDSNFNSQPQNSPCLLPGTFHVRSALANRGKHGTEPLWSHSAMHTLDAAPCLARALTTSYKSQLYCRILPVKNHDRHAFNLYFNFNSFKVELNRFQQTGTCPLRSCLPD